MSVALPIHIVATVVWLGGLFLLSAVLQPSIRHFDSKLVLSVWSQTLGRFLAWGSVSLIVIVATGIALVNLRFGGFSGMPTAHRWNMVLGIPAIALYAYLCFVPWQRYRRAMSRGDSKAAETSVRAIRRIMAVVLALGLAASVVSAAAHYYL
jgi:uncharacterized membrane protein